MRVLQVSAGALTGPSAGGAERCCRELSRWLISSGVDLLVAAPFGPGEQPFECMAALEPARWKPLRKLVFDYVSPGNARRLHQMLDEFRPDIVHFHNIYGIGARLVRIASDRAPTLVTVHDYWPLDVFVPRVVAGRLRYPPWRQALLPWVWTHRALHKSNLGRATLVSPSQYLASQLEQYGYHDVRVIPNGVTLPSETVADNARILFVGRLAPEKGLQEILGPIDTAARRGGWQIDVVGDGPLRAKLEHAFPSVQFYGWADPAPFYQRSGIVLMPSLWPENFGYVALEAMSYGVPVLASEVGGIPEIVEDGVTGWLCDPSARDQFVSALQELARDGSLRRRLGRAGRERIARQFTWASIGPRYLALYEELVQPGARERIEAGVE